MALLLLLVAAALARLARSEDGQLAHHRADDQIQQNDRDQRGRKVRTEFVEISGDLGGETERQTGLWKRERRVEMRGRKR